MRTIIKKLRDMSRNRSLFISELGKLVRLLLLSEATNAEGDGIFSALKHIKIYLRSTMGNNRQHALMLVHVHNKILADINLAAVANQFVDRKDRRKQTCRHLSQNYLLEL